MAVQVAYTGTDNELIAVTPVNPLPVTGDFGTGSISLPIMTSFNSVRQAISGTGATLLNFGLASPASVVIKAATSNLGYIAIDNLATLSLANSAKLYPGSSISFNFNPDINGIYAIAENAGEYLELLATN